MKLLVYSCKSFEIPFLKNANGGKYQMGFTTEALDESSVNQAAGYDIVSIFSGDDANRTVLEALWKNGARYIAFRSTGYNNINLKAALQLGFKVANVPNYSPHAIAEHTVALMLTVIRKIHLADRRVQAHDFRQDGLVGTKLHQKTVGIVGTGGIGSIVAKILTGFGCTILAYDLKPNQLLTDLCKVTYTSLEHLLKHADIATLHIPLTAMSRGLLNAERLSYMKKTAILVNTARGAVVDHEALLKALESKNIAAYAADVYEKEKEIFFKDHSGTNLNEGRLQRLLALDNVVMTPHMAYMTEEALENIAAILFDNIDAWANGEACENELVL